MRTKDHYGRGKGNSFICECLLDTCHFSVDLLVMYIGVLWLTPWENADLFVMPAEYCSLILCRTWAGEHCGRE